MIIIHITDNGKVIELPNHHLNCINKQHELLIFTLPYIIYTCPAVLILRKKVLKLALSRMIIGWGRQEKKAVRNYAQEPLFG